MINPWTILIAKYPDGVILFATFKMDPDDPSKNKWQLTAKYRGPKRPLETILQVSKNRMNALTNSVKNKISIFPDIDLQNEITNFYKGNKKKSIDYASFEADGKIIEEIAGELVLIDSEKWHAAREREERESSYAELVEIEKKRGYSLKWAEKKHLRNTGENLWGSKEGLYEIAETRGYDENWVHFRMRSRLW